MPELPPKDPRDIGPEGKVKQKSIGLPQWLWARLEELGDVRGYSPSEIVRLLAKQWVDEQDAKAPAKKSTK